MPPSVLLTGATGLLGASCLPYLIVRHGAHNMVALLRPGRNPSSFRAAGISTVAGDLTLPNLGFRDEIYRALAASVRCIIHCAADIRFGVSLEESRRTNVQGTENLLSFASRCVHLEKFAHMSTAYVSGSRSGHMLEKAAEPGPFMNPYQQSKFEAEGCVLRVADRMPVTIYRFSTMIYDGTSGRVAQFNYFHQLLRLALTNPLSMIPADPDAPIDLILSDWAARSFDVLFEDHFSPGEVVQICAGREGSLRVGDLFDTVFDALPVKGERPRMVDQEYFQQHLSSVLATASRRHVWHSLSRFLPHLNLRQTFDTAKLHRASHRQELKPFPMQLIFPKMLSYCLDTHWGTRERDPS